MSTIKVINAIHPSGSTNNIVNDASGNVTIGNNLTATGTITGSGTLTTTGTVVMGSSFLRNRIINGAMVIDQRNAGASVTPAASAYPVDRFLVSGSQNSKVSAQQNAGSVTPPAGFANYLGITSLSAYSVGASDYFIIQHSIEGYNWADMAFGTANAKTTTLSFYVYSSLTGTFGGVVKGYDGVSTIRSYPFTYTISSANTWTYVTVTIPGDTTASTAWSSTQSKTNGYGLIVSFGLGVGSSLSGTAGSWSTNNYNSATGGTSVVGTNGATWYMTGCQLEQGSVATPFERRQYGQELALCQRYFFKTFQQATAPAQNVGSNDGAVSSFGPGTNISFTGYQQFPVTMRASPTVTTYAPDQASANWNDQAGARPTASVVAAGQNSCAVRGTTSVLSGGSYAIHLTAAIEL